MPQSGEENYVLDSESLEKVTTPMKIQEILFVDTATFNNCGYQKYGSNTKCPKTSLD